MSIYPSSISDLSQVESVVSIPEEKKQKIMKSAQPIITQIKSTKADACFNILKGYLCIGILALPYIFQQTGYLLGTITLVVISFLNIYCIGLLIDLSEAIQGESDNLISYSEIAYVILGRQGPNFIKIMTVLFQIGTCVSYIVFFDMFFDNLQPSAGSGFTFQKGLILAILFLVIFVLSTVYNMRTLSKFSFLGLILSLITYLVILSLDIQILKENIINNQLDKPVAYDPHNFPMIIGISVFSYCIVGIAFNIRESMENPRDFKTVFNQSTVGITIFYILFSLFSQIAIGSKINEVILFNFESNNLMCKTLAMGANTAYSFAMILTFPLKFYPVVLIMEKIEFVQFYINNDPLDLSQNVKQQSCILSRRYIVRIFVLIMLFAISILRGRFTSILSLTGSLGGSINQFVIPPLIYEKYYGKQVTLIQTYINIVSIIVGIFGALLGIYASVQSVL